MAVIHLDKLAHAHARYLLAMSPSLEVDCPSPSQEISQRFVKPECLVASP
jgi:hypothetical protein